MQHGIDADKRLCCGTSRKSRQFGMRMYACMFHAFQGGGVSCSPFSEEGSCFQSCSTNQVMGGTSHPQCLCTASCFFQIDVVFL